MFRLHIKYKWIFPQLGECHSISPCLPLNVSEHFVLQYIQNASEYFAYI